MNGHFINYLNISLINYFKFQLIIDIFNGVFNSFISPLLALYIYRGPAVFTNALATIRML